MAQQKLNEYRDKGNGMHQKGNYDDAIFWYTKALDITSDRVAKAKLFSNRAASYCGKERYDDALVDANACISHDPAWFKGHFRKGIALHGMFRFIDALEAFQKAMELNRNDPEVEKKFHLCSTDLAKYGRTKEKEWQRHSNSNNHSSTPLSLIGVCTS